MNENEELAFFINDRLNRLRSLGKIFDLLHELTSKDAIPKQFEDLDDLVCSRSNLDTLIISFTYSLFDASGINLMKLKPEGRLAPIKNDLDSAIQAWNKIEEAYKLIRHNEGSHGGTSKQLCCITKQWKNLDVKDRVDLGFKLETLSKHICNCLNLEFQQ